jgi:hypothetical protein
MSKKEEFSLTAEGMLPFLQFSDLQSYCDSLSLKDLQEWNNRLSNKDEIHPEHIRAAMAIYLRELQTESVSLTQKEIAKICDQFSIGMSLMHNVRIGHIKITNGRLSLINDSAKFKMTDAGIKSVEAMLKK